MQRWRGRLYREMQGWLRRRDKERGDRGIGRYRCKEIAFEAKPSTPPARNVPRHAPQLSFGTIRRTEDLDSRSIIACVYRCVCQPNQTMRQGFLDPRLPAGPCGTTQGPRDVKFPPKSLSESRLPPERPNNTNSSPVSHPLERPLFKTIQRHPGTVFKIIPGWF